MPKRSGLPPSVKMRHDAHYVETLIAPGGEPIGRLVSIDQVDPNPNQPRQVMGDLSELKNSISEQGIIQPLIVRQRGDRFQIIAGERRYQAAVQLGRDEVPVVIRDTKDEREVLELALIENIQREDLNPMEESEAYAVLNSKYNLSHDAIARSVGKKRVTVSNSLRLLKLPLEIRKSISKGEISGGHGRAILQAKTINHMNKLWKLILKKNLSVRAAEALIKSKPKKTSVLKVIHSTAPIRAIENQLIELLGTKVKLKPGQVGGSIEILYFSDDDLERILDLLQSL